MFASAEAHGVEKNESGLTVEVLAVELLNELEHDTINRTFPEEVSLRETLEPSGLAPLVLSTYAELELFDELDDDRVIFRQTVEISHNAPRLGFLSSPK